MRCARLRELCELQLYALIFALPFEYHFSTRDQTLYTSLKLQIILIIATWMCARLPGLPGSWREIPEEIKRVVPGRVFLAVAAFVIVQWLAAALAPEFRANAIKAAGKASLGALLAFIAADLLAGSGSRPFGEKDAAVRPLVVLSCSGTCMALLGLGAGGGSGLVARIVQIFQPSEYFLGNQVRLSSTMEYPNTAGSFLSASVCASLALAIMPPTPNRPGVKWLWSAMTALQGLALALTYSRGAFVSTLIAIAAATWTARCAILPGQRRLIFAVCLAVMLVGGSIEYLAHQNADKAGPAAARHLARYGLEAEPELRFLNSDRTYRLTVAVENDGPLRWKRGEQGIAYRWNRLSDDKNLPLLQGVGFGDDVAPGQKVQVTVSLTTPAQEGEYLLILFIHGGSDEILEMKDSYSPAILCIIDSSGAGAGKGLSEKARRYLRALRKEKQDLNRLHAPERTELQAAAFRMLRHRPLLGVGPDNFRLTKSKFMGTPTEDERILSNSLYMEILSGSGILGLASFLWLIWESGLIVTSNVVSAGNRTAARCPENKISETGASDPACPAQRVPGYQDTLRPGQPVPGPMARPQKIPFSVPRVHYGCVRGYFEMMYLAGLLSHGFVDYFLKFTPTFLLFWLTLGMIYADSERAQRSGDAGRL